MQKITLWLIVLALIPMQAYALTTALHADPIANVIFAVTLIFFFAIFGRYLANRMHQPGVLGELLMGVLVGNIGYLCGSNLIIILREGPAIFDLVKELFEGVPLIQAASTAVANPEYAQQVATALATPNGTEYVKIAYTIDVFARFGVIFMLFMVGLESSFEELKRTGRESLQVAVIGVIAPMVLGFAAAYVLMPQSSMSADIFIAATLSATSIGITAKVLSEMNKLRTREAHTILGAAMLDDVLGLIILAVVSSIVINGSVDMMVIARIIIYAVIFFTGCIYFGPYVVTKAVHFFRFLSPWEAKLITAFLFIMVLAWLASVFNLAAIIGAFAAGIIMHDGLFKLHEPHHQHEHRTLQNLVAPLESILAPLFFMIIGIQVKIETFLNWHVILLASGLTLAAIVGKLVSGIGANKKDDRLLVGIGMLPRGEVGLIFASIGRTLGVMSDDLFSAIVLMVVVTTIIAPPLLKMRYVARKKEQKA